MPKVKAENPKQIFENLCTRFKPEKAGPESASFAFDLSGSDGGKFWAVIEDGECASGEGASPKAADITVLATSTDFVALVNGELNPMMALMQGKFKVQGNMGIALKMIGWFDLS